MCVHVHMQVDMCVFDSLTGPVMRLSHVCKLLMPACVWMAKLTKKKIILYKEESICNYKYATRYKQLLLSTQGNFFLNIVLFSFCTRFLFLCLYVGIHVYECVHPHACMSRDKRTNTGVVPQTPYTLCVWDRVSLQSVAHGLGLTNWHTNATSLCMYWDCKSQPQHA